MFLGSILGVPTILFYALSGLVAATAASIHLDVLEKEKIANGKMAKEYEYHDICGKDGVVLSKNLQLSFFSSKEGVLAIGPTGVGKTTGIIFPTLLRLYRQPNVLIVTDPKEELYEGMKNLLEFSGKEVYRFHLSKPHLSHQFDPISFCQDEEEVGQLAQNIILNGRKAIENETGKSSQDSDWLSMATPLLKAYLLLLWSGEFRHIYSSENKINSFLAVPNTLPRLLEFLVSAPEETLKYTIFHNGYEPAMMQYSIYQKSIASSGTNSSILSVLADCVNTLMSNQHLRHIMSGNDLDPRSIREKEKIIFIQYPEEEANYYSPFTSILFKQLMNKTKNFNENNTHSLLPTFFLLDELANIGVIPSLSNFITTCRSKDISFTGAVQSLSQLKKLYGEYDSDTIFDNLKTKVIFPGVGKDAEFVSKRAGDKQIEIKKQLYRKEVIEAFHVTHLEKGQVILVSDNKAPLLQEGARKMPKDYRDKYFLEGEM